MLCPVGKRWTMPPKLCQGRYTWERCGVWLWINGVDCFDVVVVISLAKLWDSTAFCGTDLP